MYALASSNSVAAAIKRGKLHAVRWGNWWILRSEAERWRTAAGKGKVTGIDYWSPRADEFILRARDAEGRQFTDMARMMGWRVNKVMYRYGMLKELPS